MPKFKFYRVLAHIAAWLLFMAFPILFLSDGPGGSDISFGLLKSYTYWLFCLTYIALYYINGRLLIPRLFLKKRYFSYWAIILVLFSLVFIMQPFDKLLRSGRPNFEKFRAMEATRQHMQPNRQMFPGQSPGDARRPFGRGHGRPRHIDNISLFLFFMIVALSTAAKILQQWQLTEQRATQAEADKASAELSFLKAQINPHFLFNTLNNIYTLSVTGNEHASDSIMKLSNIMRYVTEEVTDNFVPLQNEIDCISDYIELQRLRVGQNTPIEFNVIGNPAKKAIAPLVLMTFIENVFKYGVSSRNYSPIEIKIVILDSGIAFFCQNLIFTNRGEVIESTGIGIKNTRKRLERLYPGKHLLIIDNDNEKYSVNLTLQS